MPYRPEIDGLRAISIALVVLFHAGSASVPGGFIGVDVFFVISGYLITGLILFDIDQARFSLASFYERRIKRIIPALLAVVAAVLAVGPVLLLPGDFAAAGRSALYAVASLSNYFFLYNTGYFDAAAESMPLLHTWSLAVEEQFYLVWPILLAGLAAVCGRKRAWLATACLAIVLASFAWSVVKLHSDPKAAFFLPQARAWELGVGALLAFVPRERWPASRLVSNVAGALGLALILWAATTLGKQSPFPGPNALHPVLGTALLVAPWRGRSLAWRILSLPPFVFLGRISYSLYLWHWPLFVLYRHYDLDQPLSFEESALLVTAALALSVLSWRLIEQPARRTRLPRWAVIRTGVVAAAAVALAARGVVAANGFPQRIPAKLRGLESLATMWSWDCRQRHFVPDLDGDRDGGQSFCIVGADWDTARVRGVLFGDSHMSHFAPLLDEPARQAGVALIKFSDCMPLVEEGALWWEIHPNYTSACTTARNSLIGFLRRSSDVQLVVLAAMWSGYVATIYRDDPGEMSPAHGIDLMRDGFGRFQAAAGRPDLRFLVLSDVPYRPPYGVGCLMADTTILWRRPCPDAMLKTPIARVRSGQGAVAEMIRALPKRFANFSVVMPQDAMCDAEGCITSLNGEFLYRDESHLRRNMTAETRHRLARMLGLRQALEGSITAESAAALPGHGPALSTSAGIGPGGEANKPGRVGQARAIGMP